MLFENKERTYMGRRLGNEPIYEYLDRSARSMCDSIREILNSWIIKYPQNERSRVLSEFQSGDEKFTATFFELYLYSLLLRLGAEIQIHPQIPSSSARPEFLVKFPNGVELYLEAKTIYMSKAALREEKLIGELYEKVNCELKGCNFGLQVCIDGQLHHPIRIGKIAKDLYRWVQTLDKKTVIDARKKRNEALKSITKSFKYNDWSIDFIAIPLPDGEVITDHAIMFAPLNTFLNDSFSTLRDKISKKSKHYGEMNKPFVIAINVAMDWGIDHYNIFQALFGQEIIQFYRESDKTERIRVSNGVWTKLGCQHTRVSAILIAGGLEPYAMIKRDMELIYHPFTENPLPDCPLHQLTHYRYHESEGSLVKTAGIPAYKLINLPKTWDEI